MVNDLRFITNPTLYPFTIDIFTMEEEPERQAYDVKQGEHFVNSFSFIFLEFLVKFY
jgi:hypothetical protein